MTRPRATEPGPGQESVWDYPRPPAIEPSASHVRVEHGGRVVAETTRAIRILETSQAPGFYLPPDDVDATVLMPSSAATVCEWKGVASYLDLAVPGAPVVADAAWCYRTPEPRYAAITGYVAFYPQRVDACFVDGERVENNEGTFYGGWVTSKVAGPFKGGPGSGGW